MNLSRVGCNGVVLSSAESTFNGWLRCRARNSFLQADVSLDEHLSDCLKYFEAMPLCFMVGDGLWLQIVKAMLARRPVQFREV